MTFVGNGIPTYIFIHRQQLSYLEAQDSRALLVLCNWWPFFFAIGI